MSTTPEAVEHGVFGIQVDEMRRQQPPPLPCGERGAVETQRLARRFAAEFRHRQQRADAKQRNSVAAVAIERLEDAA